MNVIGDIAGQKRTLDALLAKMPQEQPLALGDLNDRGPDSKGVIQFFMKHCENWTGVALNSNHGHMMVDAYLAETNPEYKRFYDHGLWLQNGGTETINNYCGTFGWIDQLPKKHIQFLQNRPMYHVTNKFFISHAPLHISLSIEKASRLGNGFHRQVDPVSRMSLIWNREVPNRPHPGVGGRCLLFGHNGSKAIKVYTPRYPLGLHIDGEDLSKFKDDMFALCLDTSYARVLTGLNTKTMTIYQQEYLD